MDRCDFYPPNVFHYQQDAILYPEIKSLWIMVTLSIKTSTSKALENSTIRLSHTRLQEPKAKATRYCSYTMLRIPDFQG